MKRGFTLVEILIVVAVIIILSTISVAAYDSLQEQAADSQAKSLVSVLTSALDKYYSKNNEYPTAEQLFNGTPNGALPASYATAGTLLGMSPSAFTYTNAKFMPCTGNGGMSSACSYEHLGGIGGIEYVKYITKTSADLNTYKQYFVASTNGPNTSLSFCELVMRNTLHPNQAYIITYWSRQEQKVKFVKSSQGEVEMYNAAEPCVFTAP